MALDGRGVKKKYIYIYIKKSHLIRDSPTFI